MNVVIVIHCLTRGKYRPFLLLNKNDIDFDIESQRF